MSANVKWRLAGAALIALGLVAAWIFGLGPLREAQAGAKEVSYPVKLFAAAPVTIVVGLFLVAGGDAVGSMIRGGMTGGTATGRQRLTILAMIATAAAAGLAAWFWFDAELRALGYVSANAP